MTERPLLVAMAALAILLLTGATAPPTGEEGVSVSVVITSGPTPSPSATAGGTPTSTPSSTDGTLATTGGDASVALFLALAGAGVVALGVWARSRSTLKPH